MLVRNLWREVETMLGKSFPSEIAKRDARLLLQYGLDLNHPQLYGYLNTEVPKWMQESIMASVTMRLEGEPMQYIIMEQEFWGLSFQVSHGVLIPRPETEHLVEYVLTLCGDGRLIRIADLGSGSGCIAVALALALPKSVKANIEAIEREQLSCEALATNIEKYKAGDRVRLVEGDMAEVLRGKYDILVSNPPYIPTDEMKTLPLEVQREPQAALEGGYDGLDYYHLLGKLAIQHLTGSGHLVVEIGSGQAIAVSSIFANLGLNIVDVVEDLAGIPRVVAAGKMDN